MITHQHLMDIFDYSADKWRSIQAIPVARDLLQDPHFLSANHSCLVGEKGVGKTVLACQKALQRQSGDLKRILYVSLDDTLFSGDTMFDIAKAASDRGVRLVVFDEVHRYPNWKAELKSIADRLPVHTITSGSSILSFNNLGGLSRRMVKYELPGLSFREYLNLRFRTTIPGAHLKDMLNSLPSFAIATKEAAESACGMPILALFEEYLQRGYYAFGLGTQTTHDFLPMLRQATEDTIAFEIVVAQTHSRPDMARKLQALFKAIAQQVPFTVDYQALKECSHIVDLRTLKHYLACLQQAGIIRAVDRRSLKNLRKPEKLYLGNTCLYYAYADLRPNMGSLRENCFVNCLRMAGHDVLVHPGQADFTVGPWSFESGGPGKNKRQLKHDKQPFVVRDAAEPSHDPSVIPLWLLGFVLHVAMPPHAIGPTLNARGQFFR